MASLEAHRLIGTPGRWLTAGDFVSTDGCAAHELGLLGFPRAWPSAYYENQALRSLLGKKGVCRAGRVAVVRDASSEVAQYTHQIDKASLLPWQGPVNADRMQLATQLKVVEGWAVFERLELPCGESFVAMKYAWNVLPDGRWVDFSPWPSSWDQILLAESSQVQVAQKALQSSDWQLAQRLQKLHQMPVDSLQDNVLELPQDSKAGGRKNEMDVLKEELARALEEADAACLKLRMTEAKVAHLRQSQDMAPAVCKKPPTWGEQCVSVGALVEVQGAKASPDLNGERATVTRKETGGWRVRLSTGELHFLQEENLLVVDDAKERPDLTTVGTEVAGALQRPYGTIEYSLWPLVFSGFIRVRCSDHLVAQLNAQCDELLAMRNAPSHALFLQGEMKEGEQLTIRSPLPEFEEILLSCAAKLGEALIGEDDEGTNYVLDTVWTVHQMEGDYNPVHFHNNARSPFGFSSFLHLQLPPQVGQRQPAGECSSEDGGTSFIWKTDSASAEGPLECSGVLSVEMQEGYLHVFPQWVQHFVWPFRGRGERRTIAANIARLPPGMRG